MKTTLEFMTDDHDDSLRLRRAINAENAFLVLWEIQNRCILDINDKRDNHRPLSREILEILQESPEVQAIMEG